MLDHDGDYCDLNQIFHISTVKVTGNKKAKIEFLTNFGYPFSHTFELQKYSGDNDEFVTKLKTIREKIVKRWLAGPDAENLIFNPYEIIDLKKS